MRHRHHRRSSSVVPAAVVALTVVLMTGCGAKLTSGAGRAGTSPQTANRASTESPIADTLAALTPGQLPETDTAVSQLMARMPGAVAGHKRTAGPINEVDYTDGTRFEAQKLSEAAPGLTVAQFFAGFERSGQFTVTQQGGAHAPVLWLVANGAPPYHQYVVAFAATTGTWMFGLDAASAEAATELIHALAVNTN